jgi:4-oxalocrotonate tautomerase
VRASSHFSAFSHGGALHRFLFVGIQTPGEIKMPFVRIFLRPGTAPEYRKALGAGVHRALVEALAIPADDHFQVISEHAATDLIYDPQYLGVRRSDRVVFVQVTLSFGRKPQQKRKLFKRMAEILAESPGLAPQELLVNLVETSWENWSFGNGEAQYMDT